MEFSSADLMQLVSDYSLRFVAALATLIIGLYVVNFICKVALRMLDRGKVDPSLRTFLGSMVSVVLKILVYITALGVIGIEMTSFIALLGAAGLAVGMALSGTLQNFAGGAMVLMFKPYKVGDMIEAQGYVGEVKEIQIFTTVLTTPDNKTVLIPNGPLATGSLINYSTQAKRRVDWTFSISYGDDIDLAFSVLRRLIAEDERILCEPEPFVAVHALANSAVNITVRVWVNSPDYWAVFFRMNEAVYKAFPKEGLHIPFPTMDLHLRSNK